MKNSLDNKAQIENSIAKVLQLAKEQGADSAEAAMSIGSGFSATVRLGEVETIEHHRDKVLQITAYLGHKTGTVGTSDVRDEALRVAVEKAVNIAKFTTDDPYAGLADKALMALNYPDLDLYHHWNITPDQGSELVLDLEKLARAEDKRITNSDGATVNTYESLSAYGNSYGFIGSYTASRYTLSCALIADDGHGMQRDYDYTTARDPQDLEEMSVLAKRVAQRTVNRLGARKITTRQCPVIYIAELARGVVGHFISAISGASLYRNTSFLLNHLDQKIFPDYIHIEEQPHLHRALGSAPFDNEGVSTAAKDLVRNGILKSYLLGSYSARKLSMQSTGNAGGVHNAMLSTTGESFEELLKRMGTGLLITELMGQGVNIVTGDYSRGAFGYWVEHGEIQYPVEEITVAGNLKDMFANIVAVGNDIDRRGNVRTGSILIEKMIVAGH